MEQFLTSLYNVIWSPLVYVSLGTGLLYTILTRVMQVRLLPDMVRSLFSRRDEASGTTSFQAFTMALGGRVGVGNIAGVATAIAYGGPGALFWMMLTAGLAASTAFIEAALGQVYKVRSGGEFRGGIPWYIEKGLGVKWFAVLVAATAVICYTLLIPGVQSSTIVTTFEAGFGVPTWITGIAITALTALVVFGGTRRIVTFTQYVVPFMALAYIIAAVVISLMNADRIPAVASMVMSSAFGTHALFGGMMGAAVSWGVRRSLYSNVAGVGEGGYAGAAASVSHPAKQGLVQAFSVYIDTVLVCSATGVMILSTNSYNIFAPDGTALVEHLPGVEAGAGFTQIAVDSILEGMRIGPQFVAIAVLFFAFTSILSYFYFGVTNAIYLTGKETGWFPTLVRLLVLASVYFGTVRTTDTAWAMGDIGYGVIAWFNMVAIALLVPVALKVLRDYERQRKAGIADPQFDPAALGIRGATFWEGREDDQHRSSPEASAR